MKPTCYPFDHPDTVKLKLKKELAATTKRRTNKEERK